MITPVARYNPFLFVQFAFRFGVNVSPAPAVVAPGFLRKPDAIVQRLCIITVKAFYAVQSGEYLRRNGYDFAQNGAAVAIQIQPGKPAEIVQATANLARFTRTVGKVSGKPFSSSQRAINKNIRAGGHFLPS